MLKLKIQKEPYWLEIGYGVKVKVKPCTSAVFYEAKAYMNSKLAELAKIYKSNKDIGISDENAENIENPRKREALADKFLLIGLGVAGILEWSGVLEAESEDKAPLTEDKIEELFSNFWVVAENFRNQYCGLREVLEAEKNVSLPVARAKWHFGDGRSYCAGCNQDGKIFCPFHKCRYIETSLKTVEGYQAWEILLKLSKPDLTLALSLAQNLGLDMEIMSELLPIGIFAILDNQRNECS